MHRTIVRLAFTSFIAVAAAVGAEEPPLGAIAVSRSSAPDGDITPRRVPIIKCGKMKHGFLAPPIAIWAAALTKTCGACDQDGATG